MIQLLVQGRRGEKMTINLCNTSEQLRTITVGQLKKKITEHYPDYGKCLENKDLFLIFADKRLDDDSALLIHYGIQHLFTIQLVAYVPGGGGPVGDGSTGDKDSKNQSMENLFYF